MLTINILVFIIPYKLFWNWIRQTTYQVLKIIPPILLLVSWPIFTASGRSGSVSWYGVTFIDLTKGRQPPRVIGSDEPFAWYHVIKNSQHSSSRWPMWSWQKCHVHAYTEDTVAKKDLNHLRISCMSYYILKLSWNEYTKESIPSY